MDAAQADAHGPNDDVVAKRRQLERQLAKLKTLCALGDVTKAAFLDQRERLRQALEGLTSGGELDKALGRAAAFLNDVSSAWAVASDEQCNTLARLLFEEIRVKDDWVIAVQPQPSFAPFFNLDCQTRRLSSGCAGDRSVRYIMPPSVIFLPTLKIDPETGDFDSPSTPRRTVKKLTADQRADVRRLASTRSLRELALNFDVSHETIRAVLRSTPVDAMAAD